MRVKLEQVCNRGSSNLMQREVASMNGKYPIYGAAGQIGTADFYHQEKPYVAVVKDGAGIGRTMLLPAYSSVIGTLQYLIPKDNVLPAYLCYVVQHMRLAKYFSGATIPHIYFRDYKNEEFNLVSIDQQRETILTLDKIQGIISHRRAQLAKLDELVKCRFVELFGDPVAPEKKWKVSTFGNEFEIFSGGTPSTGVSKYWDNGTIPWIGSNLCQDAILKHTDGKHITDDGFNNSSAKWAHAGYVLVALVGATIGKTALLTISTTTNQNIASINVPGNINYTSEYIYMLMRFLYTKFMELGNGGFKMANLGFIRQLPLLTPPISLQSEYSAFVHRIDKSRFVVKEGEKAVKTLKRLGLGVNEIDRTGKIW